MSTVLVTGGARSGKSHCAEQLLGQAPAVTYLATGLPAQSCDAEWQARVAAHRQRRPGHWLTVESIDIATAIRSAPGCVLVDCLGTWLARTVDAADAWAQLDRAAGVIAAARSELISAIQELSTPGAASERHLVLVSNEVGSGIVPDTTSGRFFRDQLGALNTQVASVVDRVLYVVAGRVLELSSAPIAGHIAPL